MKETIFAVENYSNTVRMEILRGEVLGFIHREDVEAICIVHNLRGGGRLPIRQIIKPSNLKREREG